MCTVFTVDRTRESDIHPRTFIDDQGVETLTASMRVFFFAPQVIIHSACHLQL
jgi:hypothetical protein